MEILVIFKCIMMKSKRYLELKVFLSKIFIINSFIDLFSFDDFWMFDKYFLEF